MSQQSKAHSLFIKVDNFFTRKKKVAYGINHRPLSVTTIN